MIKFDQRRKFYGDAHTFKMLVMFAKPRQRHTLLMVSNMLDSLETIVIEYHHKVQIN